MNQEQLLKRAAELNQRLADEPRTAADALKHNPSGLKELTHFAAVLKQNIESGNKRGALKALNRVARGCAQTAEAMGRKTAGKAFWSAAKSV